MAETPSTENPLDVFREFITASERQWNGFFREVLGTDSASTAMNLWVETQVTVQRLVADALEQYYGAFNIPTHGDLVALGERLKVIEDTLARIEAAMEEPRSAAASRPRATKRPRPKRTRRPPQRPQSVNGAPTAVASTPQPSAVPVVASATPALQQTGA